MNDLITSRQHYCNCIDCNYISQTTSIYIQCNPVRFHVNNNLNISNCLIIRFYAHSLLKIPILNNIQRFSIIYFVRRIRYSWDRNNCVSETTFSEIDEITNRKEGKTMERWKAKTLFCLVLLFPRTLILLITQHLRRTWYSFFNIFLIRVLVIR